MSPILLAGCPDENVYVSWVLHTAHKRLTPGHPIGRPPLTQAVTGQTCLCLCAFSFPDCSRCANPPRQKFCPANPPRAAAQVPVEKTLATEASLGEGHQPGKRYQ